MSSLSLPLVWMPESWEGKEELFPSNLASNLSFPLTCLPKQGHEVFWVKPPAPHLTPRPCVSKKTPRLTRWVLRGENWVEEEGLSGELANAQLALQSSRRSPDAQHLLVLWVNSLSTIHF